MKRVVVESPLAADTDQERESNRVYARACCRECLIVYGEAPFASHLLYDQPGLLDDKKQIERQLGINAGLEYVALADATVVYTDRGISPGMMLGIEAAQAVGRPVIYRTLAGYKAP